MCECVGRGQQVTETLIAFLIQHHEEEYKQEHHSVIEMMVWGQANLVNQGENAKMFQEISWKDQSGIFT